MGALLAAGHAAAPLAIDLLMKLSLASAGALAAIGLVGRRRPGLGFSIAAAALLLGLASSFVNAPLMAGLRLPGAPAWSARALAGRSDPGPRPAGPDGALGETEPGGGPAASAREPEPGSPGEAGAWLGAFGLVWLLGVAANLVSRLAGLAAARRLLRGARPCTDPRLIAGAAAAAAAVHAREPGLLISGGSPIPYSAGLLRPSIVLPPDAAGYAEGRLSAVLLHETMHAKRRDNLVAELLHLAASLAWMSPLPWRCLAEAMALREEVCDEAALRAGMAPSTYAASLLEAARSLSARPGPEPEASAAGGKLERRILAVLSWGRGGTGLRGLRGATALLVLVVAFGACLLVGGAAASPVPSPSSIVWQAASDPLTSSHSFAPTNGSFRLELGGGLARIRLSYKGSSLELSLPEGALPARLPLGGRTRLGVPNGRFAEPEVRVPFILSGWNIWNGRPSSVLAAAPGTVISSRDDRVLGPVIELDHGSGLRTRYALRRYGESSVRIGQRVAAGSPIGSLGEGYPDDLPYLQFGILLDVGGGELLSLDPAPFMFRDAGNRALPLGSSALNAAVWRADRAELGRLLALGLDPNRPAVDGSLPLEWTVMTQNVELARDLVAAGADPRGRTALGMVPGNANSGPTIARYAIETGNAALISVLAPGVEK
ncbi:MAG TPA: M56 family metallopeptidase [Rectinemataceae bacterium]|nr:M56 family metallopeptidase [Rectinemataceae bacterium]